jgi:GAF domain-containing protein
MEIAPLPSNESARLDALRRYEILDTESEQAFDDLVELAAKICETPIALVSLVDPLRQWFKAKTGVAACETSRDIAFCAHAILQRAIFEVPDTLADPRFAANPLVTAEPFIRFYAGTPLVTPDGYALGTLCVIDRVPRQLNADQREALSSLGRQVMSLLELRLRQTLLERSMAAQKESQLIQTQLSFALDHGIDGAALLDRDRPWIVTYRTEPYLMAPETPYERTGDVPNVFFPCAALVDPDTNRIAIYYGAADTVTGLVFGYADEIIEYIKTHATKRS